jgi:DNA-binding SARP family transcriptional activator/tetratricopeptide (TPR) repeat protein
VKDVAIRLLGGFEVTVDSRPVPPDGWPQRRAADLVKLLAMAPGHRLARDQVLEALWPHLEPGPAAANLHKAASYARRALGERDAVVLAGGQVQLAPNASVTTDLERLEAGDGDAWRGELLPDDRYAEWTAAARERAGALRNDALRRAGRWDELATEDPADERAQRELARRELEGGDRVAAVRRMRTLRDQLAELGTSPSAESEALERAAARGHAVRAPRRPGAPIAGRERELAVAANALDEAAAGRGGALLVAGAAGIGKTRHVEELLAEAERRDFHTLRGAAHEEEGRAPYAPAIEAVDPLVAERPDLPAGLPAGAADALALLLPSLPRAGRPRQAPRHRLLSALAQLLARAAAERPLLLVVEDLHAADEATLGLVHYLARFARDHPLLVVAGAREEQMSDALADLRASLLERRAATEVRLGPLDRAATSAVAERVARRPLPEATVRAIERSAAGNPFFVEELAAGVDAAGELSVPDRLQAVLDRRLDRIEPLLGELAAPLAVLEDGLTADELAEAAGSTEAEAAAALAAARAAGVLDEARGGHRFRHPLVREALLARLPAADVEAAHARAAARLEAAHAPPEHVAHHLLHGGRAAEAVPLLIEAAEWAASVAAYADGLEWVEHALPLAGREERARLLALRARLLDGTGDRRAPDAYSEAIAAADPQAALELRLLQTRACIAAGDIPRARAAIGELDPAAPADRGRVALWRGMVAWFDGDLDRCARSTAEAAPLLEEAGLDDELATLDDLRAMAAHASGDLESHARWRLREVAGVPELAGRIFDGYLCVSEYVLQSGGPYAQLAGFAKRLRAQARQTGARRAEAFAATLLGETELLTGNLAAAREHLADAAALNREIGASAGEAAARMRLGEALLHLGDRDGAAAHLDEALELAQESPLARHLLSLVHAVLVQVPADPEEALVVVDRAEALMARQRMCAYCPAFYQVAAAIACAGAGAVERSGEFLARAEHTADLWPAGPWRAALAEARGRLRLAEGDRAEAAASLRRAAEGFAASGQLLNERRARSTLAALG